jgi:hypothetical protein
MLKASLKGRPSVYRIRQIETPMAPDRGRNTDGASAVKAKQSSPQVDNSNDAKPS